MSSTAKRLGALEQAAEQARAARIAEVNRLIQLAFRAMARADLNTLFEMDAAPPEWVTEVWAALKPFHGEPLPGGDEARAWEALVGALPNDAVWPAPPAGAAAYFDAEAARCDEARDQAEDPTEAFMTGARWSAALWRYWAAQARVMGDGRRA